MIETLTLFIRAYWKFFVAVVVVIVFLALVVWFFKGAFAPTRNYEVTIEGDGKRISVAPGEDPYSPATLASDIGKGVTVSLVNRSGNQEVVTQVSDILTRAGFTIASSTPLIEATEEKTVVVYNSALAEKAIAVSELLDNALLSAFTSNASSSADIVVYIGTQSIEAE